MNRKHSQKFFVGSAKTLYRPLIIPCIEEEEFDAAIEEFKRQYEAQVKHTRKRVNELLFPVYGRKLPFKEKILSTVLRTIKEIETTKGTDIRGMAKKLRRYTKENLSFFRMEGLREVPVDSDRIVRAFEAAQRKEPVERVKFILFK